MIHSTATVSRAGADIERVPLVIEIDINAGLRVEGIADARNVPPVDLMRVRPERNHADLPARFVGDIESDALRIMAAADFEMSGEFLFGDKVEFFARLGWVHVHAWCCRVNGVGD